MRRTLRRMSPRLKSRLITANRQNWRIKHLKQQGGRCFYCQRDLVKEARHAGEKHKVATLDHMIPLSRDGADHFENTCAACPKCNAEKGDMTADEYRIAKEFLCV